MNKYLKILIFLTIPIRCIASPYCLDRSYHAARNCGPDYKKYHKVCCTCPCNQYEASLDRAQCFKCKHYKNPDTLTKKKYFW